MCLTFCNAWPTCLPRTASKGAVSMPMTSMEARLRFETATTSSILMNEEPITTSFLPSVTSAGTVRRTALGNLNSLTAIDLLRIVDPTEREDLA